MGLRISDSECEVEGAEGLDFGFFAGSDIIVHRRAGDL